jgi:hypothetical protein
MPVEKIKENTTYQFDSNCMKAYTVANEFRRSQDPLEAYI